MNKKGINTAQGAIIGAIILIVIIGLGYMVTAYSNNQPRLNNDGEMVVASEVVCNVVIGGDLAPDLGLGINPFTGILAAEISIEEATCQTNGPCRVFGSNPYSFFGLKQTGTIKVFDTQGLVSKLEVSRWRLDENTYEIKVCSADTKLEFQVFNDAGSRIDEQTIKVI